MIARADIPLLELPEEIEMEKSETFQSIKIITQFL
jgi:hypothetical protein